MADFMIHFLLCNLLISGVTGIVLTAKRILKKHLSSRMQYNLWFVLLSLLAVPFMPFHLPSFPQLFSRLGGLGSSPAPSGGTALSGVRVADTVGAGWMDDFALSINSKTPSVLGSILFAIWIAGMITMLLFIINASLHLRAIMKSALPLQNSQVRTLYDECLHEMRITRKIPVCSSAFLKSPIIVGLLKPCIYLPIHLISDYDESDTRYMLLHELQHYKHKDALAGYLMNLAGIVYWFNPFVWYALKQMRDEREIACDAAVLNMLEEDRYADYGKTLIRFAEKISLTPFPFTAGLGGNKKQIERRIMNIATYHKPSFGKRLKGTVAFLLTAALLFGLSPVLSTHAAETSHYSQDHFAGNIAGNISTVDLSAYFGGYEGCFVLYDLEEDSWRIYDMDHATLRVSPDSTYKIYDALFGLEAGVITPDDSFLAWDGTIHPFEAWNTDQTLESAMQSSVNWYFHAMDERIGTASVNDYIQKIGYGNKNMNSEFPTYWMESSLKISPVEQVELLIKLHANSFGFSSENIRAVKDAICLSTSDAGTLYGKTGTGRVDEHDVNGWFVGYTETEGHTYFFATNISAGENAAGSNAAEITMSILPDLGVWPSPPDDHL